MTPPTQLTNSPAKAAPPSLVIFDCDGVLVDSEAIATKVIAEAMRNLELEITDQQALLSFKGYRMKDCLEVITARLGHPLPDHFEQELRARSADAFRNELRSIPDIEHALDQIVGPYCVASNGPRKKIRLTLGLTGLLHRFEDRIFSAYEVGSWKPDPGLYLHAAAAMGVQPKHCVVIEDSVVGVRAARAAGMRVLGFESGHEALLLAAEGATVFDDMRKLPALITAHERLHQ